MAAKGEDQKTAPILRGTETFRTANSSWIVGKNEAVTRKQAR